jgi:hypothetical protein
MAVVSRVVAPTSWIAPSERQGRIQQEQQLRVLRHHCSCSFSWSSTTGVGRISTAQWNGVARQIDVPGRRSLGPIRSATNAKKTETPAPATSAAPGPELEKSKDDRVS